MKLNRVSTIITALAVATMFDLLSVIKPVAAATVLFGLTDNNELLSFDSSNLTNTSSVTVTGVNGSLLGIDFRPSNGLLYGVTTNSIYTINPTTGVATLVGPPATPFTLNGSSFGVDFNPVPDLLRVVSDADQNLRLNPNNGGLAGTDTPLAYDVSDANFGTNPNIVAAAYTNNFAGATSTTLYDIDSNLDILVTQGSVAGATPAVSPNTGRLFTVGSLGIDFGSRGGFDILTTNGVNTAFAASGSTLYNINLSTGAATTLGTVGSGRANIVGLAATSVPEPGTVGSLIGFGALALIGSRYRRRAKSLTPSDL